MEKPTGYISIVYLALTSTPVLWAIPLSTNTSYPLVLKTPTGYVPNVYLALTSKHQFYWLFLCLPTHLTRLF